MEDRCLAGVDLAPAGAFLYRAGVGGGLQEHEYDHVFVGRHDADPRPAPAEVDGWRWTSIDAALAEAERSPDAFTPWFALALREMRKARDAAGIA